MAFASSRSARQSIYPQPPPEDYFSVLDSCSQSLHASCSSLNSATTTLHQGTYDFPRLATIVGSRRCFEVVTESEVRAAQRDLASEIEPQIKELIERAEDGLEGLKKREKVLQAKMDKRAAVSSRPASATVNLEALERQLNALREKKETLGRMAERLEGPSKQARAGR